MRARDGQASRIHYFVAIGVVSVIFASVLSVSQLTTTHDGNPQQGPISPSLTQATSLPTHTVSPAGDFKWNGSPADPIYIRVEGNPIHGYIQAVGVNSAYEIAVPADPKVAGWFNQSVAPGAPGLSIIDGHVNSVSIEQGIFYNLQTTRPGDVITVQFGDDSQKNFTVYRVQTISRQEANAVLFAQDQDVSAQLNLITCIGTYDRTAHTYDKRVIVSAKL